MSEGKLHTFYCSKAWRDLSYRRKVEEKGRCQRCGAYPGMEYLIGHHKIELDENNVDDANISLNPELIEVICIACHNREHKPYYKQKRKERHVYIVYGSPLSGKTTMVREMMQEGDIVLDIDAIWQAITFQPNHIKPDNCKYNVFKLRDDLYDQIKTRYGKWNDAYIIGGYPDKYERERVARELGAELIYCESTKEECLRRRIESGRPEEYDEYIKKWWERFSGGEQSQK